MNSLIQTLWPAKESKFFVIITTVFIVYMSYLPSFLLAEKTITILPQRSWLKSTLKVALAATLPFLSLPTHGDEVVPAGGKGDTADIIRQLRQQIDQLDQKIKILERKDELAQEDAVKKKKENPKLTASADKGFSFTSADDAFQIRFRGLIQTDARSFIDHSGSPGTDAFLLRRARPILEGKVYKDFTFNFTPDFGGSSVVIQDAWLNYQYAPWLQLRAGKYKAPVGLELLQTDAYTLFNERALPTNLVPNRDIGFSLHGETLEGILTYQAGVFNGVGDGRNTTNVDLDSDREFIGRIFTFPFKTTHIAPLKGIGAGIGGSLGDEAGTGANALPSGYLSDGQQTFFAYNTGGSGTATSPSITADGKHWRLAPQAYNFWGPFGFLGEYTISSQQLRRQAGGTVNQVTLDNAAWQIAGSWVLTGEDAAYNGVKPRHDFNLTSGHFGALQLVGRYSELKIDGEAFPLYATAASANNATSWAVGLNWYLNRNVRVGLDYSQTGFSGGNGSSTVVRAGEQVVLSRLQLAF